MLQPSMQKGPWKRSQLYSTHPVEIAFSSNAEWIGTTRAGRDILMS